MSTPCAKEQNDVLGKGHPDQAHQNDLFDTALTFFPLLWGCCFGFGSLCFGTRA